MDIKYSIENKKEIVLDKEEFKYFVFRTFENGYLVFDENQNNILFLGKDNIKILFDFPSYLKIETKSKNIKNKIKAKISNITIF